MAEPGFEISFDLARMDFERTSQLIKESYWGSGRTDAINRRAFENALCCAAFVGGEQAAFGRMVTDYAVFAYVSDVIVWPQHRGKGLGKALVRALIDHPDLSTVTNFSLRTADAHGLYAQFGFAVSSDGMFMRMEREPSARDSRPVIG